MHIGVWGPLAVCVSTAAVGCDRGPDIVGSPPDHADQVVRTELGVRDFPGIKPKQLLEILVMERGHSVSKSRLADLLWPTQLPRNYIATLETYVSVLRQTLEPGVRARESVIRTEHGGYRLDLADGRVSVDLDEFDERVRSVAGLDPVAALGALRQALGLIRGRVFEDEPNADWAEQIRTTYQVRHVQALIDAGRLALLTGEPTAALGYAEEAVALNPLAESAYQVLMTAAYSLWRQEEALRAYERCRRLLAEELGADPMDETVALHLAILRHEDVAGLLPRLPAADATPTSAAPAAVPAAPVGRPGLLGRTGELARLEAAARDALTGRMSLLLVGGEPGMGKTHLVDALVDRLGVRSGQNRCSDLEAELPYVALALALRPLLAPDSADVTPVLSDLLRRADEARPFDRFARLRAMEDLAKVLGTAEPFVLVLDDAQWADDDTIATLNYLRRRSPGAPAAVVLTCRREALQRDAFRNLAVDLRVDLDVLSSADLAPLGRPDLHEATGGHPMFVSGWLQAREQGLIETYPAAIRERVITRCWDLGPQAYRLLSAISALGHAVRPELLAALVGTGVEDIAEELERLAERRLLAVDRDGSVRFRHVAERELLAETMSPVKRQLLVQRAAAHTDGPPRRRATDQLAEAPSAAGERRRATDPARPATAGRPRPGQDSVPRQAAPHSPARERLPPRSETAGVTLAWQARLPRQGTPRFSTADPT